MADGVVFVTIWLKVNMMSFFYRLFPNSTLLHRRLTKGHVMTNHQNNLQNHRCMHVLHGCCRSACRGHLQHTACSHHHHVRPHIFYHPVPSQLTLRRCNITAALGSVRAVFLAEVRWWWMLRRIEQGVFWSGTSLQHSLRLFPDLLCHAFHMHGSIWELQLRKRSRCCSIG